MAQRIARPAHLGLAILFVIGLLVQIFLAGLGVFSGAAAFATHRDVGYTLTALPVLLAISGGVGGYGRRHVSAAVIMFVQFLLQSVLVLQRDDVPAIAALHPVNGFLITLIAVWLLHDAWVRRAPAMPVQPPASSARPPA